MLIQYLEIVTPDVDAVCANYELVHGASFGDPVPELGNARTTPLANGGMLGVRAPMSEVEEPLVRPYMLVEDAEAAIKAAENAGGEIALPAMEIPGHCTFAIYLQGGIQHAVWQE